MMMDADGVFTSINQSISKGRYHEVRPMIDSIVSSHGSDIATLIKCASLLKVIDDEEGCDDILDIVVSSDISENDKFTTAVALRGLNRYEDALNILSELDEDDPVLREKARASLLSGDHDTALSHIRRVTMEIGDKILLTEILMASGDYDEAYREAEELVEETNGSYGPLVNLCTVMIMMGRNKEAIKTARKYLKDDKKNADALALAAYVMRINGKTAAAANFAHHALVADNEHIGALETMAMCLIEKKRIVEAKVLAGAINNKEPGDPAVIRILDACNDAITSRGP